MCSEPDGGGVANQICGDYFEAPSAVLEPATLNPLVVRVMSEVGIDISNKETQALFDVFTSGQLFAYVITVCDETVRRSVRSSPDPPPDCTGVFAIHHGWRGAEPRGLTRFGSFVTRCARRSKRGARKSASKLQFSRHKLARCLLQEVSANSFYRSYNWPQRYRRQDSKENGFYCLKLDIFSPEKALANIADRATPHLCWLSDSTNSNDGWRVHDEEPSAPAFVVSCDKTVKEM